MSSRASERSAARRPYGQGDFLSIESFQGVSSYTAGGNNYTSQIFKQLERVAVLEGFSRNGLRVQVVTGSVSGNQFKVQFYANTGGATLGQYTGEIAGTTSLASDSFWVIEEGS